MKATGHPEFPYSTISCACGNRVVTRSTRGDYSVDVCGNCHPFYTGKQKVMDTAGRVDRFNKRFNRSSKGVAAAAAGVGAAAPAEAAPEAPTEAATESK